MTMFMKIDIIRDIYKMRFNVKTSITKVRGTIAKKTHGEEQKSIL